MYLIFIMILSESTKPFCDFLTQIGLIMAFFFEMIHKAEEKAE